ncbi:MAG: hypothetical protein RSG59_06420 [Ruthenibacterium sp.]
MSGPLSFRLCTAEDKPALVRFLDENWGSRHPLVHCEDYFTYYYESDAQDALAECENSPGAACGGFDGGAHAGLPSGSSRKKSAAPLQFAFAIEDGVLVAVAGYVWANRTPPRDLWVSIWCARKGKNGAGLELMDALPRLTGARVMACNNIRPKTMAFYTFLGYTAARLPHFYRLADRAHYQVALVAHKIILPAQGGAILTRIPDKQVLLRDFLPDASLRPAKDAWYLARRYFDFPRQHYDVYGVYEDSGKKIVALLVTRTVPVNGTQVLRIVDYVGAPERFASLGTALDGLMQAAKAEYADCYCYGIPAAVFAAAGFAERAADDENIIPNYLTPPLYENTEYYFFTSDTDHFTLFKADGDQDRPNLTV